MKGVQIHNNENCDYNYASVILWTTFEMHFRNAICCILPQMSLKFLAKGPNDYGSSLAQLVARPQTAGKPSPEPMTNKL